MKKYLIISIGSIVLAIVLITQLYTNTDIGFVDAIVENTTTALGIKSEAVEKKIERKKEEELRKTNELPKHKLPEASPAKIEQKATEEQLLKQKRNADSIARVEKENSMKKVFNAKIDNNALNRLKEDERLVREKAKADSIALASVPKKKPLFNAVVENKESYTSSDGFKVQYFEAKVHGSQKFLDNQEVLFRTGGEVVINGKVIPSNFVFRAKANVFDGKVHFMVKDIDDVKVVGENYTNSDPGLLLTPDNKLNNGYIISDGMSIKFGVRI